MLAGFAASTAAIVVVYPADDDFNAGIIDRMAALLSEGCDVVCASRFMPGGTMQGCPWLKSALGARPQRLCCITSQASGQRPDQWFSHVFAPG